MERFKITYKRGHGPGGQHKNKVESCVHILHIPSGMTETCQDQRSQNRNKTIALARLRARVEEYDRRMEQWKRNTLRVKLISGGTTVRTYNFARNEVKDHRTGKKANLKKVLNGALNLLR